VTDLPVIFLDAYEDFHVSYVALGRRRDAPCMKSFTFTRNRASRFKNRHLTRATTNFGRILEGDEESSTSSDGSGNGNDSGHGSSLCSDPSSGYSEDEDQEKEEGEEEEEEEEDLYPITRRTSQAIIKEKQMAALQAGLGSGGGRSSGKDPQEQDKEEEEEEEEPEICVGALDVKYMRLSYFMTPGDAREESNPHFNSFLNKASPTSRVLLILCAKLKSQAVIDERHWTIPDENNSAKAKTQRFRKEIYAMRREQQRLLRLPSRRSQSMEEFDLSSRSAGAGAGAGEGASGQRLRYDPRADVHKMTDTGDPLPADAIGYAYVSLAQLKCSAVKRLDIGAPLTYAIKHLPKERSVPMMRVLLSLSLSLPSSHHFPPSLFPPLRCFPPPPPLPPVPPFFL
jgi:hypothetical protein